MKKGGTSSQNQFESQQFNGQRGSTIVEWAVIAIAIVIFLSGFFTLILPQLQKQSVQSSVESTMLEKLSVSPPQLITISGEGRPANGVTFLNETDINAFNQEAYNFLLSVQAATMPTLQSFGINPQTFVYCLGLLYDGELVAQNINGTNIPLTRSSVGLGVPCTNNFYSILSSEKAKQFALLKESPALLPGIPNAYATNPIELVTYVVVAVGETVCTLGNPCFAGMSAGNGSEAPLDAPEVPTPIPSCGALGQDCCAPLSETDSPYCNASLTCTNGKCSDGMVMPTPTATATPPNACGGENQGCCATGDACNNGLYCNNGTCGNTMPSCGYRPDPCCQPGNVCYKADLACINGQCLLDPGPTATPTIDPGGGT